jgi:hypothetical protein
MLGDNGVVCPNTITCLASGPFANVYASQYSANLLYTVYLLNTRPTPIGASNRTMACEQVGLKGCGRKRHFGRYDRPGWGGPGHALLGSPIRYSIPTNTDNSDSVWVSCPLRLTDPSSECAYDNCNC